MQPLKNYGEGRMKRQLEHTWFRGVALSMLSAFLLFAGTGCETMKTYTVNVESRSEPARMSGKESYRIETRNRENDESSLRYKETEEQVRTALSGIGLYEAPNPDDADMVVEIDYGVGPPKEILKEYQEPIYITVPGRMEETIQYVKGPDGRPVAIRVPRYRPPETVYAGSQTRYRPSTVYDKYLTISGVGVDREQGDERRESLWTVNVTNQSESDDLREHIPVMVAAALDYIGTSTENEEKVKIRANDQDVAFIKDGYSRQGPFAETASSEDKGE